MFLISGFLGSSLITYYRLREIRDIASPHAIVSTLKTLQHEIEEQKTTYLENTKNMAESLKIYASQADRTEKTNLVNNTLFAVDSDTEAINRKKSIEDHTERLHAILNEKIDKLENSMTGNLNNQSIQLQNHFSETVNDLMTLKIESGKTWNTEAAVSDIEQKSQVADGNSPVHLTDVGYELSWRDDAHLGIAVATLGLVMCLMFGSSRS